MGPRREGREGCRGLFSQSDGECSAGRCLSEPGICPRRRGQAVASATAPSPVPCSPSPRVRRRAGVCRQGGRLPPSGKGLVATAMSQATQLVTPTSKEPKAGVSHRRERQPPGRPGPEGTIRSAGPLDKGPSDHEVTLSVRRSPFLILR